MAKNVDIRLQGSEALCKRLRTSGLGKVGIEEVALLRQQSLQQQGPNSAVNLFPLAACILMPNYAGLSKDNDASKSWSATPPR